MCVCVKRVSSRKERRGERKRWEGKKRELESARKEEREWDMRCVCVCERETDGCGQIL